jgi:hypothetical protein
MKSLTAFSVICCLIFALSCSGTKEPQPTYTISEAPVNPNGDSELALLMREMFEDAERMKEEIKAGKTPKVLKAFEEIYSAKATEPEKAESPIYHSYAQTYLASLNALKNADSAQAAELFHDMVNNCMSCHKAMCPGPTVRIQKLYLTQN